MAIQDQLDAIEDKIRTRQNEITELTAEAVKLKKGRAEELMAELKALGIDAPKTAGKRMRDPNKKCPICGQTGHDGRFHRKETVGKKK